MGLDQFAYTRADHETPADIRHYEFVWRKHAKLQEFMEQLFVRRTELAADALNIGELEMLEQDFIDLEAAVKSNALPDSPGGFFYGHQYQDESVVEYRDYDLEFCVWARKSIRAGNRVYYSCWW